MSLSAIHRKIALLEPQMTAAAAAEDFETAARLRNEISELRGEDAAGASLVRKPPPGQMGLGTQVPIPEAPRNWRRPKKPDPMTTNVRPRKGR